jgi:DUF1009 family protein
MQPQLKIRDRSPEPERIGLLAGSGRFPITFAEAARRQGHRVFCVGVMGMAGDELAAVCDRFVTAPISRVGRAIRLFKAARIDRVVMAGKIQKTVLFTPFRFVRNVPDWRTIHMLIRYTAKNKSDDTMLLAVIREFERDGIQFASALEYCPELLVDHGFLTRRKPSPAQWRDIHFGWQVAKEMGRLDIGQSVCISDTAVIAVEAIEGTDECVRRAGRLCRRGKFTVVKVAKPQQDLRFDVPTIGVQTIQTMHEAGARVLAIESGMTIMLDEREVLDLADRFGIAVVSLNADELHQRAVA